MIDPMKEARKGKWFKYYYFLAGIKIRIDILKYKLNERYRSISKKN